MRSVVSVKKRFILSCTSPPSRRVGLQPAVSLLTKPPKELRLSKNASLKLRRSTAYSRSDRPSLHPTVRWGVRNPLPWFPEVPTLRVWLPFRRFLAFTSWRASFSSQRSWASPFRALLLPDDRKKVTLPLSALAFPRKTLERPRADASAAWSHPRSRSPKSQPVFLRRVGDGYSLGLTHLSGSLSEDPPREASPFTALPSRSSVPKDLTTSRNR